MTPVSYTAPRGMGPVWLAVGDQVLVRPAAPDADAVWVPAWPALSDRALAGDRRWMTVRSIDRSVDEVEFEVDQLVEVIDLEVVKVELEDLSVLVLAASAEVLVRIPCEATP
jgi:hypothetical protein